MKCIKNEAFQLAIYWAFMLPVQAPRLELRNWRHPTGDQMQRSIQGLELGSKNPGYSVGREGRG